MPFKYPSHKCDPSPVGAHYYINFDTYLWKCKYCNVIKATPIDYNSWASPKELSSLVRRLGLYKGYNEWLDLHPQIKKLLQEAIDATHG
jgi:hypothetical protein